MTFQSSDCFKLDDHSGKKGCTIYIELLLGFFFSPAHILLHCNAVLGPYTLISALKRETGAFSGMVSGVSLSSICFSEPGST